MQVNSNPWDFFRHNFVPPRRPIPLHLHQRPGQCRHEESRSIEDQDKNILTQSKRNKEDRKKSVISKKRLW